MQLANGETLTWASGQDTNLAVGNQLHMHSGQAIGVLAGAVAPGEANTGLKAVAAQGPIELQAQSDTLAIQARDQINVLSAHANVDFAAAKSITLNVAGGASLTIAEGNITFACPGTITIHAGQKSFTGPTSLSREMNAWPKTSFDDVFVVRDQATGEPLKNTLVELVRGDGSTLKLVTDDAGRLPKQQSQFIEKVALRILGRKT